ncbi:MAG: ATP-dependent zinc metalloprotease FtsH [Myxococcota bacterium]|nr:ATP-dependent zinc metalloprotease FtsH [Myxococcota bacterium]
MKQAPKTFAFWLFIVLLCLLLLAVVKTQGTSRVEELSFNEFHYELAQGSIAKVTLSADGSVSGERNDENATRFHSNVVLSEDLIRTLGTAEQRSGDPVTVNMLPAKEKGWGTTLFQWLPLIFIVFFLVFLMRQLQAGGGKAAQFGKSKARLLTEEEKKVTFADVAGVDEAKEELDEIVQFLKSPKKFTRLGGRIPKGVLLMGPPGTGKTLLARAIAGEADVPFFSISGSDFVEMFVGVGASRVRDLFDQGKKNAPCIIFVDEIDAVGRHRGAGLGGGHDEREQTLNQLLVEMDGFDSNDGVILIAATNRPDVLDPALLRPGRFDRRVVVPQPDLGGREKILGIHASKVVLADDCDLGAIARGTPGFTGADLENLVNEAALLAARHDKDRVTQNELEASKDKVMMGAERRSVVMSEQEKKTTAYHEAGHALVAAILPGTDPVHRVTIIPRGRALGLTQQLPTEERFTRDKTELLNNITILMGGRAAEEIALDQVTTGAGNDIERATGLARKMVCEWGMSDELGPLSFGKKDSQVFLGRELQQSQDLSEDTAMKIDLEVKRIVTEGYAQATKILKDNLRLLHTVSMSLLEKETLTGDDILRMIRASDSEAGTSPA